VSKGRIINQHLNAMKILLDMPGQWTPATLEEAIAEFHKRLGRIERDLIALTRPNSPKPNREEARKQ